jgi:hypothetical protein
VLIERADGVELRDIRVRSAADGCCMLGLSTSSAS